MHKTIHLLLFLIPASLIAVDVRAQSQGGYVGGGLGGSDASFNSSDFSLGLPQVAESQTKTDTGMKLFAGIRFDRNWAAEVGYTNLGKFKYNYNGAGAGTAGFDYKVSGFTLSGVGTLPLSNDLSLFGRVGLFGSTAKISLATATGAVGTALADAGFTVGSGASTSKTNLYFGIGGQYDFTRSIAARVEYEDYGEVGDSSDTGRVSVSLISASVLIRF